jgi:hypothetical protein
MAVPFVLYDIVCQDVTVLMCCCVAFVVPPTDESIDGIGVRVSVGVIVWQHCSVRLLLQYLISFATLWWTK